MALVSIAKQAIRATGLRSVAGALLRRYARLRPHHVCRRQGIRYDLDLSEVIDLGIYTGGWEPTTVRFLEENVDDADTVIEVGANIGAHTLILARLVGSKGRVYAFEPTEYALAKLNRNLSLNPELARSVVVRQELVTDNEFSTPTRSIKSSWLLDSSSKAVEQVDARATSLDKFIATTDSQAVDLLKIDVDGYDFKVLKGATGLLDRFRPTVFIELCEYRLNEQNDSIRDILRLMDSLGYRAFLEDGRAVKAAEEVLALVGSDTSVNGVFRPASGAAVNPAQR